MRSARAPPLTGQVAVARECATGVAGAARQVARWPPTARRRISPAGGLATGWPARALQRAHPGQRPVSVPLALRGCRVGRSPARPARARPARVRTRSESAGASELEGGRTLSSRAPPRAPTNTEVARLHGAGEAARPATRRRGAPRSGPSAHERQRLKGLGRSTRDWSSLRAGGFADAMLPAAEPRLISPTSERGSMGEGRRTLSGSGDRRRGGLPPGPVADPAPATAVALTAQASSRLPLSPLGERPLVVARHHLDEASRGPLPGGQQVAGDERAGTGGVLGDQRLDLALVSVG